MEELAVQLDESRNKYYYWHHQQDEYELLGDELLMSRSELLDETAPPPPPTTDYSKQKGDEEEEGPRWRRESMVNKLISTVYSGPTISDIESALSFTGGDHHQLQYNSTCSPVVFSPEKVLSKMENKYTLKIKTCGNNGVAEDGYKWRKYGQKSIKNSPNPRSYYRCTNPRCNAKKQVERATDEPDTLVVTYEGLHLHYTYSHFLHAAQAQAQQQGQGLPKKPKKAPTRVDLNMDRPTTQPMMDQDVDLDSPAHPLEDLVDGGNKISNSEDEAAASASFGRRDDYEQVQQHHGSSNGGGLLEDVVPLLVRRPCGSSSRETTTNTVNSSSPSPSTSSVSCWTPTSPYIDMAILSNIF